MALAAFALQFGYSPFFNKKSSKRDGASKSNKTRADQDLSSTATQSATVSKSVKKLYLVDNDTVDTPTRYHYLSTL